MQAFALETDFEIEEHVAEHNKFFKQTALTLDDLDAYAVPLGNAARAVYDCSEGFVTEEQVFDIIQQSVLELRAIHAAMDLENAA
jgi:hypothetical protein